MSKENTTEFIVLGLLTHEDQSGYDLKQAIDRLISQFWEVGYGQLYPTLHSLEEEGFVSVRSEPSEKGPERKVYSITPAGQQKLINWLRQPAQKEYVKYEILLKVFFGGQMAPSETLARISEFQQRSSQNLHLLELYEQNLHQVMDQNKDHLYFYLTVLFGKHIYQAYTTWAEEAVALLQKNSIEKENEA
jgi:DNA-binding PadR family transcriptional regulator